MSELVMHDLGNNIFVFENAVDANEVLSKTLLQRDKLKWHEASVGHTFQDVANDEEIRKCSISPISPSYNFIPEWDNIIESFSVFSEIYEGLIGENRCLFEVPQLLHYRAGNKEMYRQHCDQAPPLKRVYSAILYLNDVEEGGETYFNHFNISVKPKAGNLLMFPSPYPYVHEAREPISGDKFCVATWFKPFDANDDSGILVL